MKNNLVHYSLLKPLSKLWENAYRLRRGLYEYGILKRSYFKVPIVSIGNLSFGGTGKTPVIVWFVNYFEKMGLKPLVLTRGYKGDLEHSRGILRSEERFKENPFKFGDEPLLILKKMKKGSVVVGKKRSNNLRKYFPTEKPDIVLLDDGFQHLELFRLLNIVLFDALLPLEMYKTAPIGYLREGLSSLKDADAVLITRADQVTPQKLESLVSFLSPHLRKNIPISFVRYIPQGVFNTIDEESLTLSELSQKRVLAVSGIASPESFYKMLESLGANLVGKISFKDHYNFTLNDINNLLIKAIELDATIIVSEKDIVKIKKISQDRRINYLSIEVDFVSGKEELLNLVHKILNIA